MEGRRTPRRRGYGGQRGAPDVRGFSIPNRWLRGQTEASAPLWNGLLRNLVSDVNAVEEIIIFKKLIPL